MKVRCFAGVLALACLLYPMGTCLAQVSPESAEKYVAGQDLFKKRRFAEALVAFEEAVTLDGNNAQAYRAMARTYQKMRNFQKAAEAYQMSVTIKPDYVEAFFDLGQMQFQSLRKYEDAQKSFQKVLELDLSFEEGKASEYLRIAYLKQGNTYHRQKNYKQAARQYRNASQLDTSDPTVFYNLGLAERFARNYKSAERSFTTATALDPNYAKAHRSLGDLYRVTKRNRQAIRSYNRAIKSDSNCKEKKNIKAYLNLAVVYAGSKQLAKAETTLKKALKVSPRNQKVRVLLDLGYVQARQKKYQSAISMYRRALKLKPKDSLANYRIASAYLETQKYQSALNHARKSLGSRYDVPANIVIADAFEGMKPEGWKEKAIRHYKKALKDRRYQKYAEDKIDRILNPMGDDSEEDEEN